jgi:dTDP-4-dehydrorhamnose 3,5-epimerase
MIFHEVAVEGAYVIDIEPRGDDRGFFARTFCRKEFEALNLNPHLAQANIAFTKARGTVRGLHYQLGPHAEAKLVRCTAGALYDLIVDLRPHSPTYKKWIGVELSSSNYRMLFVPQGCAHGYQTLVDESEISYNASEFYSPEAERGVRFNDPAFNFNWPLQVTSISDKDRSWPDYVVSESSGHLFTPPSKNS